MPDVRVTIAVAKVLAAFLEDPAADRYGLDLMRATGQPSGTLYPILVRLQRAGWVEARWEEIDPAAAGRPPRRYYRLTSDGVAAARRDVAEVYQHLHRVAGAVTQPRLAPMAGPA
jgi:PadR family transcriptional regulator PadR